MHVDRTGCLLLHTTHSVNHVIGGQNTGKTAPSGQRVTIFSSMTLSFPSFVILEELSSLGCHRAKTVNLSA